MQKPLARSPLDHALADGGVRRLVSGAVRRGVPTGDAEDVVQAVFCDALDARTVPANPGEIPFWLVGIARNRVVDFFRRGPREIASEEACMAASAEPFPFELRDVVDRMASRCDAEQRRTLSWMMLEGEGVPFQSIAEEEGLSPTAVRARVYRLRRLLRREFAGMLTVLLIAGGAGAIAHELRSRSEAPVAEAAWGVTPLPAWAVGDFEVAELTPDRSLDATTRALALGAAQAARVSIHAGRVDVRTPTTTVTRRLVAEPDGESALNLTLEDGSGGSQALRVTRAPGGVVVVESVASRWRGTVVLRPIDARPR